MTKSRAAQKLRRAAFSAGSVVIDTIYRSAVLFCTKQGECKQFIMRESAADDIGRDGRSCGGNYVSARVDERSGEGLAR